ncbi:hypothetical protein [Geodermatophilus sp. SYSU D01176]
MDPPIVPPDRRPSRILLLDLDNCGPRISLLTAYLRRLRKVGGPFDLAYVSARPDRIQQGAEVLAAEGFRVLEASDQPDAADEVLAAVAAAAAQRGPCEFVVVSCDADLAVIADHGPLTVLASHPRRVAQRLRARAVAVLAFPAPDPKPRRRRRGTSARMSP